MEVEFTELNGLKKVTWPQNQKFWHPFLLALLHACSKFECVGFKMPNDQAALEFVERDKLSLSPPECPHSDAVLGGLKKILDEGCVIYVSYSQCNG